MKISKALLKEIIEEEIKSLMEEEDETTAEDELEKIASDYVDLYKSIRNFKPEVKDTDTIEDLKAKITALEDEDAAAAFEELVNYAKNNPPSEDDPEAMKTGVVEGE
jgi:hypothetical protein